MMPFRTAGASSITVVAMLAASLLLICFASSRAQAEGASKVASDLLGAAAKPAKKAPADAPAPGTAIHKHSHTPSHAPPWLPCPGYKVVIQTPTFIAPLSVLSYSLTLALSPLLPSPPPPPRSPCPNSHQRLGHDPDVCLCFCSHRGHQP
jgi:hypothetical protein